MAKVLSMREQVDCLILAMESNLDSMQSYMRLSESGRDELPEDSQLFALYTGMNNGAKYCAEMTERTLSAAKRQRERWEA